MMKAIILSAGYGMRLRPLTEQNPKPLLKIGKETLLSNTIKFLEKCGVKDVVVNVHYLGEQIVNYINKEKFNINITVVEEKEKILDTGGGVFNAIKYFSNDFLIINPDTIWTSNYIEELKLLKEFFFKNKKNKCCMLVVNKKRSFDQSLMGDFELKKNLINRNSKENLDYIYTGLQIIKPEVFFDINMEIFSINKIWDKLIKTNELSGIESKNEFLHITTSNVYKKLLKRFKY